jgi:hypothetical protein
MKIDTKEINKINSAIDFIDGWEMEDFKVWQTKSGRDMATIRLKKSEIVKEDEEKVIGTNNGTLGTTVNIAEK